MFRKTVPLLFLVLSLSAKNWSFNQDTFAGYRSDQFKDRFTDESGELVNLFKYNSVQSVAFGQQGDLYLYNFLFRYLVDYSWIQSGTVKVEIPIPLEDSTVDTAYNAQVRGTNYDVWGFLGYQINFYQSDRARLFLTPLGGYSLYHQAVRHKNIQPSPFQFPPELLPMIFTSADVYVTAHPLNRSWWGPNAGADLGLEIFDRFSISGGYSYNWLKVLGEQNNTILLTGTAPGLFITVLNEAFGDYDTNGGYGHLVRGDLSYKVFEHWSIGLKGWYLSTGLNKLVATETRFTSTAPDEEGTILFPETTRLNASWQTYSITLKSTLNF